MCNPASAAKGNKPFIIYNEFEACGCLPYAGAVAVVVLCIFVEFHCTNLLEFYCRADKVFV